MSKALEIKADTIKSYLSSFAANDKAVPLAVVISNVLVWRSQLGVERSETESNVHL